MKDHLIVQEAYYRAVKTGHSHSYLDAGRIILEFVKKFSDIEEHKELVLDSIKRAQSLLAAGLDDLKDKEYEELQRMLRSVSTIAV